MTSSPGCPAGFRRKRLNDVERGRLASAAAGPTRIQTVISQMTHDRIVSMANQIARAFAAEGEARAVPQIADHIDKFWDPRMKAALAKHLEAGGEGLSDLARKGCEKVVVSA